MFIQFMINIWHGGHIYHVYLNALSNAKKYGWPIITNAEYVEKPLEYHDIFMQTFDMVKVTEEEKRQITQLGIKEDFFGQKMKEYVSWTNALNHFYTERDDDLENLIEPFLLNQKQKKEIRGLIIFGESFESVKYLAKKHELQIINTEFTSIRKVNHYTMSLMYGNMEGQLYKTEEGHKRFNKFQQQCQNKKLFSRRELIALFEKKENIYLLPLMAATPKYEVGVARVGAYIPMHFQNYPMLDADLELITRKQFGEEHVLVRDHPSFLSRFDMFTIKETAIDFVLSCKRIASVASNTLFEAMLWERMSYSPSGINVFSFAGARELVSDAVTSVAALNFIMINLYIPGQKNLFSNEYWQWRLFSDPSEEEIWDRHLSLILKELQLPSTIMELDEEERFQFILRKRGFLDYEIKNLGKELKGKAIAWETPYSKCIVQTEGSKREILCPNYMKENLIVSEFHIEIMDDAMLQILPLYNVAGFITIHKVKVDGEEMEYRLKKRFVPYEWSFDMVISEESGQHNIVVCWSYEKPDSAESIIMDLQNEKDTVMREKEKILNSKSWKLTKPLRVLEKAVSVLKEGKSD